MSLEDALKLIQESKQFLEPFVAYGQMISDGIAQLDQLKKLVEEKANDEAYRLSCTMCEQISNYRAFVPDLVLKLEKIREILKCSI
jgi:hypothetical protein